MSIVGETNEILKYFGYLLRVLFEKLVIANADLHVLELYGRVGIVGNIWSGKHWLFVSIKSHSPASNMLFIIPTNWPAATDDGSRLAYKPELCIAISPNKYISYRARSKSRQSTDEWPPVESRPKVSLTTRLRVSI